MDYSESTIKAEAIVVYGDVLLVKSTIEKYFQRFQLDILTQEDYSEGINKPPSHAGLVLNIEQTKKLKVFIDTWLSEVEKKMFQTNNPRILLDVLKKLKKNLLQITKTKSNLVNPDRIEPTLIICGQLKEKYLCFYISPSGIVLSSESPFYKLLPKTYEKN